MSIRLIGGFSKGRVMHIYFGEDFNGNYYLTDVLDYLPPDLISFQTITLDRKYKKNPDRTFAIEIGDTSEIVSLDEEY